MSKAEVFVLSVPWVSECICCDDPLLEGSTAGLGQTYRKCLNRGETFVGEEMKERADELI